jgi:hypothetical protein
MKVSPLPTMLFAVCTFLFCSSIKAQDKVGALDFKGGESAFYKILARTTPYPGFDESKSANYYFQVDVSKRNEIRIFEKTGKKDQATEVLAKCLYELAKGFKNSTGRKQSIIVPILVERESSEGILTTNPDAITEADFKKKWLSKKQTMLLPLKMVAYASIRCHNRLYVDPSSL